MSKETIYKNKYFGTDGFRGEAGITLTADHAYKIGRFAGAYFSSRAKDGRARVCIGKDTRRSSYMLEYAMAAGLASSGADVYLLHVTTTPSVSYITKRHSFDLGVMITASHNPFCDNGIKLIDASGEKLGDAEAALIEKYIDGEAGELPFAFGADIGAVYDFAEGRGEYVAHLTTLAEHSFEKMKIGLDMANGAAFAVAGDVFKALGARVFTLGDAPNGMNINLACGSTHAEMLARLVREKGLDIGFAFDGDGDRCIAVDENGAVVDGDKMMYIFAKHMAAHGRLAHGTLAATVMSNSGFFESLARAGISCVQTAVGDRFVYEKMKECGYSLGGEQSGHIIFADHASTGDGILTAIMLANVLCESGIPLSSLASGAVLYPQYVKNVRVKDKDAAASDAEVQKTVERAEKEIDKKGRILLRKSGTEPVLRIMLEAETEEKCRKYAEEIANVIEERGYYV
ncbi:MAG: phosphoglucosamine mutase [Clostridia bacterium]|nr:phosphoglucosamine mutase [Clostridia bacterium]